MTVLYVARPSISPDQPWAMRRYLPVVIPGVAFAIAVALVAGGRAACAAHEPRARATGRAGLVAVALLVAVPTAVAARPFARARAQHGALAAVHHICRAAGDDTAVLVYGYHFLDVELPQPLSGFCGVPAGKATGVDLPLLARQWRERGRRLMVATAVPETVLKAAPGSTVVGHERVAGDAEPERVFDRRPRRFKPIPVDIWLIRIPANAS
jgi:hypothetical protein